MSALDDANAAAQLRHDLYESRAKEHSTRKELAAALETIGTLSALWSVDKRIADRVRAERYQRSGAARPPSSALASDAPDPAAMGGVA